MPRMPVVFIGHGNPMNAIEDNRWTQGWTEMSKQLPRPAAFLVVSAHWITPGHDVTASAEPEQIYDMSGFPDELYQLRYPAPGSPKLASRVLELLDRPGTADDSWGIDHGSWSVLHSLFPSADIPVVQLGIKRSNSLKDCYAVGSQLRALRDEGVMIIGSGNVVHNLQRADWQQSGGFFWAYDFDTYIRGKVLNRDPSGVIAYEQAGDSARKAFVTLEHFVPLLYAFGATDDKDTPHVWNEGCTMGSISMTSYIWD